MKQLLFVFICISFALNLVGQKYTIEGTVIDSNEVALEFTSVVLLQAKDSILIGFSITNKDGLFRIEDIEAGKYLLNASFLGYKDYFKKVGIKGDQSVIEFGTVQLEAASALLDEVTINATHIPIQIKNDTVEYNADAFKTQAGDNVEELLKKLPGIEVEKDGTIKAHGEEVEKVMVEGKEFFSGDPTIATKNLPADIVDKIQVFDKDSEMAEFTGIDDGEQQKTINIGLKEGKKAGYFGAATAGYGTDERYDGTFNLNRFGKKLQISGVGMINNVNKQGFSFGDYVGFMGGLSNMMRSGGRNNNSGLNISQGLGDGFVNTAAVGFNFNYDFGKKTEWNNSYFLNRIENNLRSSLQRINLIGSSGFDTDQISLTENQNTSHTLNGRFKHEIDSTQNFTFSYRLGYNDGASNIISDSKNISEAPRVISGSEINNSSSANRLNFNTTLTYRKRLKKEGRFLTGDFRLGNTNNDQEAYLQSVNVFNRMGRFEEANLLQEQFQNNDQNSYRIKVAYTEPLPNRQYLQFDYTKNNNNNDFVKEFFDLMPDQIPDQILNEQLSNSYRRDYSYDRFGTNYKLNREQFSMTLGTGFQFSNLNGQLFSTESNIDQSYFYVLPSMNIRYQMSGIKSLDIRYTTSIREPSLEQLQPIVDNSDPLNIYIGNPDLNPEYQHRLRIKFNTYSQFSDISFFTFFNVGYTKDKITNKKDIGEFFVQSTTPINVDRRITASHYASYNVPIKFLKHKIQISNNLSYVNDILFVNDLENKVNRWNNSVTLSLNNTRKKIVDIDYGISLNTNSVQYSVNDQLNANYLNSTFFVNLDLELPNEFEFRTNFETVQYSNENFGGNERISLLNFSLSKIFLNSKKAKLGIKAVDLLNQNKNINRSSNTNYIQEEQVISLGRYFLLDFTYSFSGFGSQNKMFKGRSFKR